MRKIQGFSLIEMIAALTILTIGSAILFSWLGQSVQQLTRFKEREETSLIRIQALNFMSSQNPGLNPDGVQTFANYKLEWKSKAASEVRDSVAYPGGLGLYQIQLYEVKVRILHPDNQFWFEFPVKLVGYSQVRQPSKSTPF